jgi:hypothetical protein
VKPLFFTAWVTGCPICFETPGQPCRNRETGERVGTHRERSVASLEVARRIARAG